MAMEGTRCFGNVVLQDLLPLGGIDTVVMNTIMYTVKKGNNYHTKSNQIKSITNLSVEIAWTHLHVSFPYVS